MIFFAVAIESAIQASIAGDDLPSSCASLLAAKIEAAINKTRFLSSSTEAVKCGATAVLTATLKVFVKCVEHLLPPFRVAVYTQQLANSIMERFKNFYIHSGDAMPNRKYQAQYDVIGGLCERS